MIFDLHVHQSLHSGDSQLNIYEGLKHAKKIGLDGICITDHDSLGLRNQGEALTQSFGLKVIVGVEIYTLDGDLLCFGIDQLPEERMSAQDTIDFVLKRGGVCIAAHPYRQNNRGLGDKIFQVTGLSAIEGFNGRTSDYYNAISVKGARFSQMNITGGSDAHTLEEIGTYATSFDHAIENEQDFIEALKLGKFQPVSLTSRSVASQDIA